MIPSRSLFASLAAVFLLVLGVFALLHGRNRRLNRFFALFAVFTASKVMPAPLLVADLFGHDFAVIWYRLVQFWHVVGTYFLLCFIQDFAERYETKAARLLRRSSLLLLAGSLPIYLSPLVIRDFSAQMIGTDMSFHPIPGPMFLLQPVLFLFLFVCVGVTTVRSLLASSGIKRNQLRFIALGFGFGMAGLVASVSFSFARIDLPWLYFPLISGMSFCFAYAIFKHDLFEFNLWLKRLSIYIGVYATVATLPVFLLYPFRGWLIGLGEQIWPWLVAFFIAYGLLFSTAPAITAYFRRKDDERRWSALRGHLEALQDAAERLSDETGLSLPEIAQRLVTSLRELYSKRLHGPPQFILVVLRGQDGKGVSRVFPDHAVSEPVLGTFLDELAGRIRDDRPQPFTYLDLRRDSASSSTSTVVERYLRENNVELCAPCVHDGKLYGAILLGPKETELYWSEERTALQLTASHVATAVRKTELIARTRELTSLDELKTELISNITHEFKTPLYIVENAIEVLARDIERGRLKPERVADYLGIIKNHTATLGMFIQNLLQVARIEQSKVDLKTLPTDLSELLRAACAVLLPAADKKGISLTVAASAAVWADIDPDKIRQVVVNIVANAVKFTERGGVDVRLSVEGDRAALVVNDTGPGIAAADIDRVFEKFYQANGDRKGTGLGLAIARGWVEAHRGRIWAESKGPGSGASFHVELPLQSEPT